MASDIDTMSTSAVIAKSGACTLRNPIENDAAQKLPTTKRYV